MQSAMFYFWCGGNILVGNTKSSESKAARQALEYGSQLLCEERLGNGGYHIGPFSRPVVSQVGIHPIIADDEMTQGGGLFTSVITTFVHFSGQRILSCIEEIISFDYLRFLLEPPSRNALQIFYKAFDALNNFAKEVLQTRHSKIMASFVVADGKIIST